MNKKMTGIILAGGRSSRMGHEKGLISFSGKRMIEYADFFLPTYNGLAIDYIIESNSAIYRRKKNIYQDNQIPAVQVTHKNMQSPGWQKNLFNRLQKIYNNRSAYRQPKRYG